MGTPILGAAILPPFALAAWARASGLTARAPWPDWSTIAGLYVSEGSVEGVAGDLAFFQGWHETGGWQFGHDVAAAQFNPAGIGATGGVPGAAFPDARTGIRAQIQRLHRYATDAPLSSPMVDPRPSPPRVTTWEGLDGHWAVPGAGYGETIVNLWRSAQVSETWMPGATIERGPYDDGAHGGPMTQHLGVVMHVTTSWVDPGPFFARPVNGASSHFWIRADGEIVQYLPLEVASWAQAAGNYGYVSVETDGTVDAELTMAQLLSFAAVYRWVESHPTFGGFGWSLADVPGEPGLGFHAMGGAMWGGHPCPGPLRIAQRPAVLFLARPAEVPSVNYAHMPLPLAPVVHELANPEGPGFYQLGVDGGVYNWVGAPFVGSCSGQPWFAGRQGAWLCAPNGTVPGARAATFDEVKAGKKLVVVATSGERYALPA